MFNAHERPIPDRSRDRAVFWRIERKKMPCLLTYHPREVSPTASARAHVLLESFSGARLMPVFHRNRLVAPHWSEK
jgi:hypothetical protein